MATTVQPAPLAEPATSRAATPRRRGGSNLRFYIPLILLTLVFVSPLLFMVSTSFKSLTEATQVPPTWVPEDPTTKAYDTVLNTPATPVLRWFANSMIAAALNALLVVATAALAAYPLARMEFRGKRLLFWLIISTLFVPPVILLIPNYLIVANLGWLDRLVAIIVPTAAGAFGVFFLRQFFSTLPRELEEAARIDGAGPWQTFFRVILPLSRPALVTLVVLSFLTNWNDFLWPVYVLFSPDSQTLPPGLATLQSANSVRYDLLMAGAVVASLPIIILFTIAQRWVIEGVSRSGLKG